MKNKEIASINSDILTIFIIAKTINWINIKKLSISRVIYLSSVLYSFIHEDKENLFNKDYNFVTDLQGPYSEGIDFSLIFLKSNQFVIENKLSGTYRLGERNIPNLKSIPYFSEKKDWLEIIIHIISIYGEEQMYEFIFRDPEYQDKLLSRDPLGINIQKGNETYKVLHEFRQAFEDSIIDLKLNAVDPKRYLELYFDYVFSIILKGEEE